MTTAQVTVQYVNQPNKNPKYGSIKTAELGYVSVPAENLNQFSQGEVCTINYSTNPKGYHNLNQKVSAATPAPAMNGHAQPALAGSAKDESIFVQAMVKAPTWTDYESLRERVQAAKRVYHEE